MKKGSLVLIVISVLALSVNVWGAEKTFQEAMQENQSMRENITWMTEGLYQLNKSRNNRLALTKEQARRILPLYQELIDKKIILIEMKPDGPGNFKQGNSPQKFNGPGGPGASDFSKQSSEEIEKRMKEIIISTEFGKQQSRRIDSVLSKEQVQFIDMLDFKPEKYGYIDMSGFPGNGQPQDRMEQNQPSDSRKFPKPPKENEAARKRLIQLSRDVLNMLKQKQ